MHEELKTVGESPRLAALTAHAVGKSLHLLAEKAEYMAATGELAQLPLLPLDQLRLVLRGADALWFIKISSLSTARPGKQSISKFLSADSDPPCTAGGPFKTFPAAQCGILLRWLCRPQSRA